MKTRSLPLLAAVALAATAHAAPSNFMVLEESATRVAIRFERLNLANIESNYTGGKASFGLLVFNGDAAWSGTPYQGGIFGVYADTTAYPRGPAVIVATDGLGHYDMTFTWKPTSTTATYVGTMASPTFDFTAGVSAAATTLPISGATTTGTLTFSDWTVSGSAPDNVPFSIKGTSLGYDTTSGSYFGTVTYETIPEPATYGLLGASILAAASFVRRRHTAR